MARKPREFKPARRGAGRGKPAAEPAPKKKRERKEKPAKVDELEMVDDEEEVARGQLESSIVIVTAFGLLVGIFMSLSALGKHYGMGMMKASYEKPSTESTVDQGTPYLDVRMLKNE